MKKLIAILGIVIFLIPGILSAALAEDAGQTTRVLIRADDQRLEAELKQMPDVRHEFGKLGFSADVSEDTLNTLSAMDGVTVEILPVSIMESRPAKPPKPPSNGGRVYLPSDPTPWGIELMYNDSLIEITSGGAGVDVAVLDSGVNKDHLDLKARVKQCLDFTGRGVKSGCKDTDGHGTHVAGTILADGGADGKGIWGMAPQANLFAYKICGGMYCYSDDIAAGIRYAADQGAEIISMSIGGNYDTSIERDAIDYATGKGCLVVAAAGNDGPADGSIDYPGANVKVIAVGAIDVNLNVPSWSSRGWNDGDYIVEEYEVEFGAPGVHVESTWKNGGYYYLDGTSMATPHISGLAAKLWLGNAADTREYLHLIATDIWTSGDDRATGFGLPQVP